MIRYIILVSLILVTAGCLEKKNEVSEISGQTDAGSTSPTGDSSEDGGGSSAHPPIVTPIVSSPATVQKVEDMDSDLLGNRYYIGSYLMEIFATDDVNSSTYKNARKAIDGTLAFTEMNFGGSTFTYVPYFGGACDHYGPGGNASGGCTAPNLVVPNNVGSTPPREAARLRVCMTMAKSYYANALSKVGLTNASALDNTNLGKLYDVFYPGYEITPELLSSLNSLVNAMKANSETTANIWMMVTYSLCQTPEWQML